MSVNRLRLLYAIYGVGIGFLLPFLVPLMSARGMQPATIGLVLGASAVVSLVSYPVWGVLADGALGREGVLVISGSMGALAGLAILLAGSDAFLLSVAVMAASLGSAPWGPVTDALALQVLGDDANAFGRFRLWASVGWAASALAGGLLYAMVGSWTIIVGFTLSAIVLSVLAMRSREALSRIRPRRPSLRLARPRALRAALDVARPRARRATLMASPVLIPFLVALFLEAMGSGAAGNFMSLGILDGGGGAVLIGIAYALPAIVEIPFFSAFRNLSSRFGLRALFVFGTFAAAAQMLVVAAVPEPGVMAAARTVDGAAYALRTASVVLVVGACLPARLRTVGQSLTWLVAGGIAPIVGGPLGGLVYGTWGVRALFAACAVVVAIGAVVGYIVLRDPRWRRPAPDGAPSGLAPGPLG